jgi:hypothetical protein
VPPSAAVPFPGCRVLAAHHHAPHHPRSESRLLFPIAYSLLPIPYCLK